ncbi:hypothetical protein DPMN_157207 [Dreissena polymorpha]|uniref:Uncharacterized protein n=1 Tax=Dreissena polymorpha TaxID=45954 RepID=A0A9D4INL0_DREPO|nr:hypothetical protein DPMN_157207 [Dreissena polymorpha]
MEEDKCLVCKNAVRSLQHGITCDVCDKWQHRTCNTGKCLILTIKVKLLSRNMVKMLSNEN